MSPHERRTSPLSWLAVLLTTAVFMSALPTLAAETDLRVTEIMQNPAVLSDGDGEWFEIHNTGPDPVDIQGWTIRDDGTNSHVIDNGGPLVIAAGEYVVLGVNALAMAGEGVTLFYEYSGFFLANGDDELILENTSAVIIQNIAYDGGPNWPDPNGASMAWDEGTGDNTVGANWFTSTAPFGSGDLGTPGAPNGTVGPIAPTVSNVLYRPLLPTPGEAVTVTADAVDGDGTITGVSIIWTLDTVPQSPIAMSSTGGDGYTGTIPGQADGAVVEFFVQATDNDAQTGDGTTLGYTVAPETITPIASIHADSLGFVGTTVMIQAQVYIPGDYQADGTSVSAFVQDGSGRGLNVFGTNFSTGSADLNDVTNIVKVTGRVTWFFDTLELINYEVELVSTGNPALTPTTLSTAAAADFGQIGNYIESTGPITAIATTGGGNPAYNFTVNDGSGDLVIRIDEDVVLGLDTWLVGDELVAAGAGSQFSGQGQILVGLASDVTNNGQGPDLTPPTLESATLTGPSEVTLGFSEAIDAVTGNVAGNYEVYETAAPGNTIAVTAAAVQVDASQVVLTLAASAAGIDHTVRVNNVEDLAGNPIAPNTTLPIFEPGEVIIYINEIMNNPNALSDADGEWFEIWNAGADPVDINGWTISDLGTDSHVIDNGGPLVVAPGAYMLLGRDAATMATIGVTLDYEYSGIFLGNAIDELILSDTGLNEINFVAWDDGVTWPDPDGQSMQWLGTGFNFDGTQWTSGGFPFHDPYGDWGTPGQPNNGLSPVPDVGLKTTLGANHPNPFNPKTAFNFTLAGTDHVKLQVFDVRGRLVDVVVDETLPAGSYDGNFVWDGTDREGRRVNSGTYFFRMTTGSGHVEARKMMLLK